MTTRIERLQAQFDRLSIDSFLVSNASNQQYLAGASLEGGDGYLLVTAHEAVFITDARYQTEFQTTVPQMPLVITRDYLQAVNDRLQAAGATVLGIEDSLPLNEYQWLDEHLVTDIVPMAGVVDNLRQIKDAAELAAIRRATALTSQGLIALFDQIKVGQTERQVANWLGEWMLDHGATGTSFETIVASGKRAAWPHGSASDKVLAAHDMVTIDCGFYVDGYTSDVTRTVALGNPGEHLKAAYQAVADAQQAIIAAVKPGVTGGELDRIGRDLLTDRGFGEAFIHGTGHGIGLDIHEGPNIGRHWPDVMAANEVITVEPGVYFANEGGLRIEDDILVTATGHEILTTAPRNLIIL